VAKLAVMVEREEVHRVWNFILPEHGPSKYSPFQSIPPLTNKTSRKHIKIKLKPAFSHA
jgi:hypothetical protein